MTNSSSSSPVSPEISVIIPVYNTEKYLEACLQSVISQETSLPFEVILINDESPDNSQLIIDKYVHRYPCVVGFSQSHGRQGKARNTGIQKAQGRYILFLDSDDLLTSGALAHFHRLMERYGSDVAIGIARSFKGRRKWINAGHKVYRTEVVNTNLEHSPYVLTDTSCCNKLYRKTFLQEHNLMFPENCFCEDVDFIYRVYLTSQKLTISPRVFHEYRGRMTGDIPSGTQTFSEKRLHDIFTIYAKMLALYEKNTSANVLARLARQIILKTVQIFRKKTCFPDAGSSFYRDIHATIRSISTDSIAHYADHYTIPLIMIRYSYFTHASALLNYGLIVPVIDDFFRDMIQTNPQSLTNVFKVEVMQNIASLDRVVSHGSNKNYIFVIKRILGRVSEDFQQFKNDVYQAFVIMIKTVIGRYRILNNEKLKSKIRVIAQSRIKGMLWKLGFVLLHWLICQMVRQRTWLVGERTGKACAENGYLFFQYCTRTMATKNVYFVLDKTVPTPDDFGSRQYLLRRGSIKHFLTLLAAECFIFTNNELDVSLFLPPRYGKNSIKTVFLNHGATYYNPGVYLRRIAYRFNMIIAVSEMEKQQKITDWSLQDPAKVKVTGFPLFDQLHDFSSQQQILFCPTWRNQLDDLSRKDFKKSRFFVEIIALLNDMRLHEFLDHYNVRLIFRCHFRMAYHLEPIREALPACIKVEKSDARRSLQNALKDALLLITDYSSIMWDMAYMKKPVILYQFDRLAFLAERGLHRFSIADDEMQFAVFAGDRKDLLKEMIHSAKRDFRLTGQQLSNISTFFSFFDDNNNQRVYRKVQLLLQSAE